MVLPLPLKYGSVVPLGNKPAWIAAIPSLEPLTGPGSHSTPGIAVISPRLWLTRPVGGYTRCVAVISTELTVTQPG
jgi:hypothetical protein